MCRFLYAWVLVLSSPTTLAQEFPFPFPLFWSEQEIGEITTLSDGTSISAVNTIELAELSKEFASEETREAILNTRKPYLTIDELKTLGIELAFDQTQLIVIVDVAESASRQLNITFGEEYEPAQYSESAFWFWQNNFNASATYDYNDGQDIDNLGTWLGEWISYGNIGGYHGANFEYSVFLSGNDSESTELYRGEVRLFFDRPENPWRVTLGDVTPQSPGHLPSLPIGGVAFERLYQDLQPTRNIQNGGTQPLVLNESANIEIYINDIFLTEFRLPPGRYNLDDLPLSSGTNDIRIEVDYQSGKKDTIVYSQFFNSRLLRADISDFGFYAGLLSTIENNKFDYDSDDYIASGFYEYGINDYLTVGLNGIGHPDGQQIGFITTLGTSLGNLGIRASAVNNKPNEQIGTITSLDYSHQIWGADNYSTPNLRLGFEFQQDYFSIPWEDSESSTGYRFFGNYVINIFTDLDLSLSGEYDDFEEQEVTWLTSGEFIWRYYDWNVSLGVEQENNPNENIDETRFLASVEWDWSSNDGVYSANVSYSNEPDTYRGQLQRNSDDYVGSYGYGVTVEGNNESTTGRLEGNYVGNRFLVDTEYDYTHFDDSSSNQSIALRASTGLTLADGHIALSRPLTGPVAIVNIHESLESDVEINAFAQDPPEAISTPRISNAVGLSTGHIQSSTFVTAPNAPPGYNIGDYQRTIVPGSATGHLIQIGSAASKTVIGSIISSVSGKPIELATGTLTGNDEYYQIFTNKSGRFVVEGIAPGKYLLKINSLGGSGISISIPDVKDNLIYLPSVTYEEG
ncbi:fimbria/pilus outer membrane usher protein [Vibrio owensii]|uniref:fimbria/pilus outer membrane usher protein n=1 Tax=Vibrio owensii TaxID=696485 RepID=UPI000995FF47|nr:fimbria/pilus outer membrane usher protein [Vibrio owensii]AQW58691.1 pilus assembly protein PapC [Vibrio owensii]